MRTREIFLASLLTLTFGCPAGDDGGGETGSHESDHDTEHNGTTSGSTGSPTTTPMETSTTASTDSTSTTASMDSTSTTAPGEGSSSSSGGGNEVCETFCADYFGVCGDSADNDYGSEGECLTTCEGYDQKELDCKVYHVSVADGPKSVHCGHANIDGGGTC